MIETTERDPKADAIADAIAEVGQEDVELANRMLKAFDLWTQARDFAKKESKRLNEQLAARIAQFNEAMNVGHSTTNDQVLKLSVVETRWQDLEDARTEKKDVAGACKDAIKAAEQKIRDLLEQAKSNQLSLFNQHADEEAEPSDEDEQQ